MVETAVKVYYGNLMMFPDVSRVLACLHEKDVKFQLININKGHLPMPIDFLKLQEKAINKVPGPTFEDGRKILFESRAICRHLTDKYAEQGNKYLLGRDPLERASIEQWLRSEEHSFDPPSWTLVFHLAFSALNMDFEPDRVLIQESERKLSEVLDVYNQRLGETKYLAGNEFSLADLSHLPNSHYIANSREWGYLITSRKYVKKWWKKVSERPSWMNAINIVDRLSLDRRSSLVAENSKGLVPHQPAKFKEKKGDTPPPRPKSPMDPSLLELEALQFKQESKHKSLPFQSNASPVVQEKIATQFESPPTQPLDSKRAENLQSQSKAATHNQTQSGLFDSDVWISDEEESIKGLMSSLELASQITPKSESPKLEQGSMESVAVENLQEPIPPPTPISGKDSDRNDIPEAPKAALLMDKMENPTLLRPTVMPITQPEAYYTPPKPQDSTIKRSGPHKPVEEDKKEGFVIAEPEAYQAPKYPTIKPPESPKPVVDKFKDKKERSVLPEPEAYKSPSKTSKAPITEKQEPTKPVVDKLMDEQESTLLAQSEPYETPEPIKPVADKFKDKKEATRVPELESYQSPTTPRVPINRVDKLKDKKESSVLSKEAYETPPNDTMETTELPELEPYQSSTTPIVPVIRVDKFKDKRESPVLSKPDAYRTSKDPIIKIPEPSKPVADKSNDKEEIPALPEPKARESPPPPKVPIVQQSELPEPVVGKSEDKNRSSMLPESDTKTAETFGRKQESIGSEKISTQKLESSFVAEPTALPASQTKASDSTIPPADDTLEGIKELYRLLGKNMDNTESSNSSEPTTKIFSSAQQEVTSKEVKDNVKMVPSEIQENRPPFDTVEKRALEEPPKSFMEEKKAPPPSLSISQVSPLKHETQAEQQLEELSKTTPTSAQQEVTSREVKDNVTIVPSEIKENRPPFDTVEKRALEEPPKSFMEEKKVPPPSLSIPQVSPSKHETQAEQQREEFSMEKTATKSTSPPSSDVEPSSKAAPTSSPLPQPELPDQSSSSNGSSRPPLENTQF